MRLGRAEQRDASGMTACIGADRHESSSISIMKSGTTVSMNPFRFCGLVLSHFHVRSK